MGTATHRGSAIPATGLIVASIWFDLVRGAVVRRHDGDCQTVRITWVSGDRKAGTPVGEAGNRADVGLSADARHLAY